MTNKNYEVRVMGEVLQELLEQLERTNKSLEEISYELKQITLALYQMRELFRLYFEDKEVKNG